MPSPPAAEKGTNKQMKHWIVKIIMLVVVPMAVTCCGFYHAPEFKGTILDANTKQPLEGAVVVAKYEKETMNIFGGGSGNSIINVRETLTDKDGRFRIPSYTTFVDPLSWQSYIVFIIFKPGYVSVGYDLSKYFSVKDHIQKQYAWNKELIVRYPGKGVVELPSVKSRDDRAKVLQDVNIPGPDVPSKLMPILIRVYNEEKDHLGLQPIHLP